MCRIATRHGPCHANRRTDTHYNTDQHVAAALVLFSYVATLFWYILRNLPIFSRD